MIRLQAAYRAPQPKLLYALLLLASWQCSMHLFPPNMSQLQPAASALQLMKWSVLEKIHCLVMQTAAVTSTVVLVFYWAALASSSITGSTQSAPVLINPVFGKANFDILSRCSCPHLTHWNVACVASECTSQQMHALCV